MMKKTSFVGILLFLFVTISMASPVDSMSAKNLALKFWKINFGEIRNEQNAVDFQNMSPAMGFSHLYVLQNKSGEGFVVMSADDIAFPVLGYAEQGNIDVQRMPANFVSWLRGYEREIEFAISRQVPQSEEIAAAWSSLSAGERWSPKSPTTVSPLLSTTWDQGSPYNTMCPGTAPTGCVATAMAQVMKYHAYPPKGQGSHSYTCSYYNSTQSANFGSTTYSWSSMPNSLYYSSNSAISTIMYHCGVSVEMQYTPNGSGAQTVSYSADDYSSEHALPRFFGYKQSLHAETRFAHGDTAWISLLKAELDAGRPLIYTGYDEEYTSGHCFVCDGYNSNNQFHFNWGWSGSYDGYFSITSLNLGGGGWGGGSYDYTYGQCALFGVEPPAIVVNSNFSISPNSASTIKHGTTHTFNVTYKNRTTSSFSGSLKLVIETESGSLVQLIQEIPSVSVSGGNTASVTFSNLITAYPGSYKLVLYYKPAGSEIWENAGIGVGVNRINVNVVLPEDSYEANNAPGSPYSFTPTFSNNQTTIVTTGSNFHVGDAYDYYLIDLPSGYSYTITANLCDAATNSQQYTAYTSLRVSKNGAAWSTLADTNSGTFVLENGGPVLYKVWPMVSGSIGTYLLNTQITRSINNFIDEESQDESFSIFPNPATDWVMIELPQHEVANGDNASVQVYDIYGQLLYSQSLDQYRTSVILSDMAAGVYVMRVVQNGSVLGTAKVIKQ